MITGFSHAQLVVRDVARSSAWWATVLGVEPFVSGTIASGPYAALRHPSGFVIGLQTATDAEAAALSATAIDHLSFGVRSVEELEAIRRRLVDAGLDVGEIFDEAASHNLRLHDPDALTVELTAPKARRVDGGS